MDRTLILQVSSHSHEQRWPDWEVQQLSSVAPAISNSKMGPTIFTTFLNAHLISRLSNAAPVWSHSMNPKLKIKLRSVFYNTLRIILRDFERKMSRQAMISCFQMEGIITILEKRTSVFTFKIFPNLSPFNLIHKFMTKSYINERHPERVEFFNTSQSKFDKLCTTNAAKKIANTWNFDWLFLTLQEFKTRLRVQYLVEWCSRLVVERYQYPSIRGFFHLVEHVT